MEFSISFCDPLKKDIVEMGDIDKDKVFEIFEDIKWNSYLSKMKDVRDEYIYFSPSFEIENKENKNGLSISAVGEPDNFEFYIFYKRPKMIKSFFWAAEKMTEDFLTDVTGQTKKDALDCLSALLKNDVDFLENKIK